VEFGLLGPLEVLVGGQRVDVGGPKRALEMGTQIDLRKLASDVRAQLGLALLGLRDPVAALRMLSESLELRFDAKDEADAHDGLGAVYLESGEPDRAREHWGRALAIFAEQNDPRAEQTRASLAALG
jgi:Tfp pilus assembly protein PilF